MPTVSRTHGHCLAPLKHLLKTLHRSDDAWYAVSADNNNNNNNNNSNIIAGKRLTLEETVTDARAKCYDSKRPGLHVSAE
jgi:hypothetical protein